MFHSFDSFICELYTVPLFHSKKLIKIIDEIESFNLTFAFKITSNYNGNIKTYSNLFLFIYLFNSILYFRRMMHRRLLLLSVEIVFLFYTLYYCL